jgi:superoxide reductase
MDRRDAIKSAILGSALIAFGQGPVPAKEYYMDQVDESLFRGINRVRNPGEETGLEKLHSPVITAPDKVKAGEVFAVEIAVGKLAHPMGPEHWIEHLQLNIGNEPAGTAIFRSHGYVKAAARFNALLDPSLKGKTVSLVVQVKCNLHGVWENYVNVSVA